MTTANYRYYKYISQSIITTSVLAVALTISEVSPLLVSGALSSMASFAGGPVGSPEGPACALSSELSASS